MDRQIFKDVSPAERLQLLRDNAYKIEPKFYYTRPLEEGEIQERQDSLSQSMIEIDREDQKLKEAKEAYNSVVKPIKEQMKTDLQEIRTRSEEVVGEVFMIKDLEEGKLGYYSAEGELLQERFLAPEERQHSIIDYSHKRAGNE